MSTLPDALVTIRRYLRQNDLDHFGALINKLTDGASPFEEKIDWNDVFFVQDNLGSSGPKRRAAENLTLKPQKECSVQVVIGNDAGQVDDGLQYCVEKKPIIVIAFAETFEETLNIKNYVKGQTVIVNSPIRFDFVSPDLHRLKVLQEVDLSNALFERVKEGVLAFQMDVENYATTVDAADFRTALGVAATELDVNKLA